MPQTAWVSSSWSWSQFGDRMPAWESACRLRACDPQWATVEQPQPRWGRSAALVRRTLGQYVTVCPRLQLTSHTQPTSTLSRIKSERYIFYKEVCSFVHWSSSLLFTIFLFIFVYVCGFTTPLESYYQHYHLLCSRWMKVDMPLNKETKPNSSWCRILRCNNGFRHEHFWMDVYAYVCEGKHICTCMSGNTLCVCIYVYTGTCEYCSIKRIISHSHDMAMCETYIECP